MFSGKNKPEPAGDAAAPSSRRKAQRSYHVGRKPSVLTKLLLVVFGGILLISVVMLAGYLKDYVNVKQQSDQLRSAYYEAASPPPAIDLPQVDIADVSDILVLGQETQPEHMTGGWYASAAALGIREPVPISQRFEKIRRMNKDIVGWLQISGMVDEAVVQRDNTYYLRRDYRGYHNTNGALFLDEMCSLSQSPATNIVYGHNMKTGAMFGDLHEYKKAARYQGNPFIQFDTLHADGVYVIFAVSDISVLEGAYRHADFYRLPNCGPVEREHILERIRKNSLFISPIDVLAEDDLLILVTCIGDDDQRFIVAARKMREGEKKADLQAKLQSITVR